MSASDEMSFMARLAHARHGPFLGVQAIPVGYHAARIALCCRCAGGADERSASEQDGPRRASPAPSAHNHPGNIGCSHMALAGQHRPKFVERVFPPLESLSAVIEPSIVGDMNRRALYLVAAVRNSLKHFGGVRDGLLVIGAILYGVGYIAWSLHASIYHLGPVSGLDAQYFIAGIPVLLVLIIGWLLGKMLLQVVFVRWPAWYSRRSRAVQIFLTVAALSITVYCLAHSLLNSATWRRRATPADFIFALIAGVAALLVRLPGHRDLILARLKTESVILIAVLAGGTALIGALAYLTFIYPRIPQVLGGAEPRRAVLAIATDKIPPEVARSIAGREVTQDEKVFTTLPVFVYQEAGDALLVSIRRRARGEESELFKIRHDTVTIVKWLE